MQYTLPLSWKVKHFSAILIAKRPVHLVKKYEATDALSTYWVSCIVTIIKRYNLPGFFVLITYLIMHSSSL